MCFSLAWLANLLIWIVCVCAIVAILKLLLPWVFSSLGVNTGPLMAIIQIVIWAVIAIFVIYVAFALIQCLAGGSFSLAPLHR